MCRLLIAFASLLIISQSIPPSHAGQSRIELLKCQHQSERIENKEPIFFRFDYPKRKVRIGYSLLDFKNDTTSEHGFVLWGGSKGSEFARLDDYLGDESFITFMSNDIIYSQFDVPFLDESKRLDLNKTEALHM